MADLQAIRYGLDIRLATIAGLSHSHTVPSSVPDTPFAYVSLPGSANAQLMAFDMSYGDGTTIVKLTLVLLVAKADDGIAQDSLDPFLGDDTTNPSSIFQAVMGDRSLTYNGAATASDVRIRSAHSYGLHKIGDMPYVGCIFDCEVIAIRK